MTKPCAFWNVLVLIGGMVSFHPAEFRYKQTSSVSTGHYIKKPAGAVSPLMYPWFFQLFRFILHPSSFNASLCRTPVQ